MISRDGRFGVEALIGCFTTSLGLGALIPRPGLGLYSVLEGERIAFTVIMVLCGFCLTFAHRFQHRLARTILLVLSATLWGAILVKFMAASLWGAAIQAAVVIIFSVAAASSKWERRS